MKYYIIWFQRKKATAFLHLNGEQVIWSHKIKGAVEFTQEGAFRMKKKFNGSGPLAIVPC